MNRLQATYNRILTVIITLFIAVDPCFAMSKELLYTAKKFTLAMIGVLISSVLIFIGLTLYNRFFHNPKMNEKTTYDENTLEPAKNLDNAISNFLNRTNM